MAGRVGFEPTKGIPLPVFRTGAFSRSATCPHGPPPFRRFHGIPRQKYKIMDEKAIILFLRASSRCQARDTAHDTAAVTRNRSGETAGTAPVPEGPAVPGH